MSRPISWTYELAIRAYKTGIWLAAPFSQKARAWTAGRKDLLIKIRKERASIPEKVIWMHCASLGEFEQGRPVLEAIKTQLPELGIVLTFFSPSGYTVRKNWDGADAVWYLPEDTAEQANAFIDIVNPIAGIFVKYDFWLQHIHAAKSKNIPLYLISGIFKADQIFFKPWGALFRKGLSQFKRLYIQDKFSKKLLQQINIENIEIAPDTRFDRVTQIAFAAKEIREIKSWLGNSKVLIAGSTWLADEQHLFTLYSAVLKEAKWKLIIVPHQVEIIHINRIKKIFKNQDPLFWKANKSNLNPGASVLIIDTIGLLSSLYQYADLTYIGGGFGAGIHNTLEAAVYGIPVLFGPKYRKFREAESLIKLEAGLSVSDSADLIQAVTFLIEEEENRIKAGKAAGEFVANNTGGTAQIVKAICAELLPYLN